MEKTIRNAEIIDCVQALNVFNPPGVVWKTRLRLDRNLRKLNSAANDFEFSRARLEWSCKKEQGKPNHKQDGTPELTPEEHQEFLRKLQLLRSETQTVEIHEVEIYRSEDGHAPEDPEFAIDESKITIPNGIRATLIDIVFVAWKGGVRDQEQPCPDKAKTELEESRI